MIFCSNPVHTYLLLKNKIKINTFNNTITGVFPGLEFHLNTLIRISKLLYKGHQGQDQGKAIEAMPL